MPFYEYQCSNCRFYAEVLQKLSDAPLRKCPSCGKNTFKRLISAPVFRLKGSGWYETDFKSDKEQKRNIAGADRDEPAAKGEAKEEPKTEAKGEAKGEAKAETKPETKAEAKADKPSAEPKARARARRPVKAAARKRAAPKRKSRR
jgi:putative FmdB family regulatory protein